jgi:hypothetical protein
MKEPSNHWSCPKCTSSFFPFHDIENTLDFINLSNTSNPAILRDLDSMLFEPYDSTQEGGLLDDLDPDEAYYNNINSQTSPNCKYVFPDQLEKEIKFWKSAPNLSILHLNVRSINQNYTQVNTMLDILDHSFTVIGLTETWLKPHNAPIYSYEGYNHEYQTRATKPGGGISMHINSDFAYKVCEDLAQQDDDYEMMWLEIDKKDLKTDKNYVIGTIYRRPGTNIAAFNLLLSEKLQTIISENKIPLHMGDYNIDLLKCDTHQPSSEFLDTNILHSLLPAITKPTRVTNTSATIIDNIFSNYTDAIKLTTCILTTDISDHFPVCYFSLTNSSHSDKTPPSNKKKRDMSLRNIENFKRTIAMQSWETVTANTDTQAAFTNFHNIFTNLYNKCFPFKPAPSPYKLKLKWLSPGLKKSISVKNILYKRQIKIHTQDNISAYKKYRNHLNHLLRKTERQHYQQLLDLNKSNLRKSWAVINQVINRNKKI